MNIRSLVICSGLIFTMLLLFGCASNGSSDPANLSAGSAATGKVDICKSGDKQVGSQAECLQDDAACYRLTNGNWCTGPRGSTCPTGSNPLPKGASCPKGSKCFKVSADLNCVINLK